MPPPRIQPLRRRGALDSRRRSVRYQGANHRNRWESQYHEWDGSYVRNAREAARCAYAEAGLLDPRAEIDVLEVHLR
jgi:hypothetical protein